MEITVTPVDMSLLGRVLDGLAHIPLQLTEAELSKIGDTVRQGIGENFTSEGGAVGGWHPLALRTITERKELGFPGSHPILQRTRQLKMSWTERGHPLHRQEIGKFAGVVVITVASGDPRSDRLQEGDWTTNLPERWISILDEAQIARIGDIATYVVDEAAKRFQP